MAAGADVLVRGGRLIVRVRTPVPLVSRDLPLNPLDEADPYLFALDLAPVGMSPVRLAFSSDAGVGVHAVHVDLPGEPLMLVKRRAAGRPSLFAVGVLSGLALATAVLRRPRLRRVTIARDRRASD
jgi:hypothetical protein